jgi:hypothetical protein
MAIRSGTLRLWLPTRKRELQRLKETYNDSFKPHAPRFHERRYLRAVYELYRKWRNEKKSRPRAKQLAKICKRKLRSDTHPIRVMIDCSAHAANEKTKSKWTQALRFAYAKDIPPSELSDFMNQHGGMAGCASGFAKLKRSKKPRPSPKQKIQAAPTKKQQAFPRQKRQVIGAKKTQQNSGLDRTRQRTSSTGQHGGISVGNQQGTKSTEDDDKSW